MTFELTKDELRVIYTALAINEDIVLKHVREYLEKPKNADLAAHTLTNSHAKIRALRLKVDAKLLSDG